MRLKYITAPFLLTLICMSVASCNVHSQAHSAPIQITANASSPFSQLIIETRNNLYQEQFARLDAIAAQLRTNKERFPGGTWKLNAFYNGLNAPPSGDNASEGEWQTHLSKLRKWITQTDSITAHVGLGDALDNYAWSARGYGFADSVTEEGQRLFNERSQLAEKTLLDAKKSGTITCPHWYVVMLQVGLGQGWKTDRYNKLFEEGATLEPTYYYLYRIKAMYLMPRWYGEQGDWEKFVDQASQKIGGKEGSALYYFIASHIFTSYGDTFFTETNVSWPKVKQGFADLQSSYGMNAERLNEACKLAVWAEDSATAHDLFNQIGDKWDASVWRSKKNFDLYKTWAQSASK